MLNEKLMEMLAFDLGLLIVAGWFFILLLMFREFQKVSHAINRLNGHTPGNINDTGVTIADIASIPNESLDQLTEINIELEQKLQQESLDKKEIMLLNDEVEKSKLIIETLKESLEQVPSMMEGNDFAAKAALTALGKAKQKISRQDLLMKKLQIETDRVHVENEQLRQQIVTHLSKIKISLERTDVYSQKLIQQGQELTYLKSKSKADGNNEQNNKKIKQLQSQLMDSKEELDRISTEKDFLEIQFLDVLEEVEDKNNTTNNS
jgi:hypothetical protein